jgi:hypothetical protein
MALFASREAVGSPRWSRPPNGSQDVSWSCPDAPTGLTRRLVTVASSVAERCQKENAERLLVRWPVKAKATAPNRGSLAAAVPVIPNCEHVCRLQAPSGEGPDPVEMAKTLLHHAATGMPHKVGAGCCVCWQCWLMKLCWGVREEPCCDWCPKQANSQSEAKLYSVYRVCLRLNKVPFRALFCGAVWFLCWQYHPLTAVSLSTARGSCFWKYGQRKGQLLRPPLMLLLGGCSGLVALHLTGEQSRPGCTAPNWRLTPGW